MAGAEGGPAFSEGQAAAAAPPDIVQRAASPTRYVVMEGEAYRLGRRVPIPKLLTVGGVKAVEMERMADEDMVPGFSVPIHYAWWRIVYLIPDAPKDGLPVLGNPLIEGR